MNKPVKLGNNGRVDMNGPSTKNLFAMYDKIPAHQCSTFRDPTEGLWSDTKLSDMFFSKQNVQILQNGIRAGVFQRSNGQYLIGPQDCDSLKIIMRSVFLQHAANQNRNIAGQVAELNKIVLDYCVYQVYGEAQGYMKYLRDVSSIAVPIAHPVMEQGQSKELILKPWF